MNREFEILITPMTVAEWEKQAKTLEEEIQAKQAELDLLRQRIAAVPLFIGGGIGKAKAVALAAQAEVRANIPLIEMNPVSAVLAVIGEQSAPIAVRNLRAELEQRGYPMERFGKGAAYFYQVISRLEKAGKIEKHGDEISLK